MNTKLDTRNSILVLAGDIGGTKTLLALAQAGSPAPRVVFERRYASSDFVEFEPLLEAFLGDAAAHGIALDALAHTCLGVAGPVGGQRARPTYLPWTIDADGIARRYGGGVTLVNDFAAAAAGVMTLAPQDLVTLQAGQAEPYGARVVVGAGTGLGVAIVVWTGVDWLIVSGEGGHVGFAASNDEQIALWRHLRRRYDRVTAERVVCGAGLADIYRFLVESGWTADDPDPLQAADVPAAVSIAASRPGGAAEHAMEIFVEAYGAFAGDLALTVMARGGVFVAGGIAPKIRAWLDRGNFIRAFNAKEGHGSLAAAMPVHVVVNQSLGLQGAAWLALRHAHA